MIRNLLCHVYARREGQKWRRTVAHLLQRRGLFNGRRILTVATDETTDTTETVREAFAPLEAEIIEFHNCGLQETVTFLSGMDMLASARPNEMTLRCHSKGCTHPDGAASHLWADVMWATCCDFPQLIDCLLQDRAICGPFRSFGLWPFPEMHAWHFAGSFYWIRHDRTFNRDWRRLMPTLWAVEGWPGIFPREESACLFHDGDGAATQHLYSPQFWRANLVPEFEGWRERMETATGRKAWLPPDMGIL